MQCKPRFGQALRTSTLPQACKACVTHPASQVTGGKTSSFNKSGRNIEIYIGMQTIEMVNHVIWDEKQHRLHTSTDSQVLRQLYYTVRIKQLHSNARAYVFTFLMGLFSVVLILEQEKTTVQCETSKLAMGRPKTICSTV
jgi:hypothetical protein